MKLIFVNRYFYPDHSATAQLLSSLAFALVERGWEVYVISNRQRYDAADVRLPSTDLVQGVRVHRVWTSRFGRARLAGRMADYLTFYSSAAWRLWRLTRPGDVIVAKTDPPMLSVLAAGTAKVRGARLVNWLQDLFPEIAQALNVRWVDGWVARILRGLRDRSLRLASTNVVLGERMQDKVRDAGVAHGQVCIIPNWECGRAVRPVDKGDNQLVREWGLEHKFVIGYSGNMGRAHEFDTVLHAARLLKGQKNIAFLWIGDGAQRASIEREACRSELENFVFKPYQPRERLFESLSVSDVHLISLRPALEGLIVPSKFYGIAAAARTMLFIGDTEGEIAVALRRYRCGYSVKPGDSEVLARYIRELSTNGEMRRSMGKRARQMFEAHYEKQVAVDRWERVVQQVARVKPRQKQDSVAGGRTGFFTDTRSRVRTLTPALLSADG